MDLFVFVIISKQIQSKNNWIDVTSHASSVQELKQFMKNIIIWEFLLFILIEFVGDTDNGAALFGVNDAY